MLINFFCEIALNKFIKENVAFIFLKIFRTCFKKREVYRNTIEEAVSTFCKIIPLHCVQQGILDQILLFILLTLF